LSMMGILIVNHFRLDKVAAFTLTPRDQEISPIPMDPVITIDVKMIDITKHVNTETITITDIKTVIEIMIDVIDQTISVEETVETMGIIANAILIAITHMNIMDTTVLRPIRISVCTMERMGVYI